VVSWLFYADASPFPEQLETPFQQIHALHFEELSKAWEADRRIPSAKSRCAWAQARNLKPANVNSWWYRRRPLARKLKISIPHGTYELDIGTPPIIPTPEEVLERKNAEKGGSLDSDSTLPVDMRSSPLSGVDFATSETCGSEVHGIFAKNPLFEELSAEMDAYTRASSTPQSPKLGSLLVTSLYSTPSRENSPLPPSSPPLSSPLPWSLALPEDIITEDKTVDDHSFESLLGISLLCQLPSTCFPFFPDTSGIGKGCSSISYMPFPFVDRLGKLEELELASNSDSWIPLPAQDSWCLQGYRLTYEGCCIGICSCAFLTI